MATTKPTATKAKSTTAKKAAAPAKAPATKKTATPAKAAKPAEKKLTATETKARVKEIDAKIAAANTDIEGYQQKLADFKASTAAKIKKKKDVIKKLEAEKKALVPASSAKSK